MMRKQGAWSPEGLFSGRFTRKLTRNMNIGQGAQLKEYTRRILYALLELRKI